MFPTLSDLIQYLTGIYIPLPIQTFGFVMALSFTGAYLLTSSELKRKEALGLLQVIKSKMTQYKRLTTADFATSGIAGGLIGYKVVYLLMNYSELVADPQKLILSTDGSFLGMVAGAAYAYIQRRREDQQAAKHEPVVLDVIIHPYQLMWNVLFIAAISGLLGAKIFHNLENLDEFAQDPVGSLLSFSGLTFYGGLIVASISVLWYTSRQKIPVKHMIDAAAPGLMLAYGIGRIGCQLSGDGDWGIVNQAAMPNIISFLPGWFWSFDYPHNVINAGIPIEGCEGPHCYHLPFGVYPTPLYEAIVCIALAGFLWSIRKKITTPGILFCVYLMLNGVERFFIEKIRVNSTYTIFGNAVTQAELISTLLFAAGLIGIIYLNKTSQKSSD